MCVEYNATLTSVLIRDERTSSLASIDNTTLCRVSIRRGQARCDHRQIVNLYSRGLVVQSSTTATDDQVVPKREQVKTLF